MARAQGVGRYGRRAEAQGVPGRLAAHGADGLDRVLAQGEGGGGEGSAHRQLARVRAELQARRARDRHRRRACCCSPLEPRKPVKTNLATLRKFLSQHPSAEAPLAQRFGRYVARALVDEEVDTRRSRRAGLYFARWFPDRLADWIDVLRRLWEQGLSISDLSGEDEQRALLDVSHAAGVESDAILSALDSRFAAVRSRASDLHEHLDRPGRADLAPHAPDPRRRATRARR